MDGNVQVARTRRQILEQSAKFILFSASAGIIQFAVFTLLTEVLRLRYWPAYLVALTMSVLFNFTLNRRFTFRSANNVPIAMLLVAGYYLVFTPLSTWWGDRLTGAGWNPYLVLIGTMLVNFTTEFLYWRFVVFGRSIDTNELARMKKV